MTDAAALRALLARVEASAGPDRELDARIWHALAPDHVVLLDHGVAFGPGEKSPPRYGPLSEFPIDGWEDYEGVAVAIGAQPYTSSLDAAVALVGRALPGAIWDVESSGCAWIRLGDADLGDAWGRATPALALVAALLRALIARPDAADRSADHA